MIQDERISKNRRSVSSTLKLVSAKWTVEIIDELSKKPTRTRQFLSCIPGLSMKCLRARLCALEQAGIIARVEYDEKVPHVEHHLTDRGKRLLEIYRAMRNLTSEINSE